MLALSGVVMFYSSIVVLIPRDSFCVVPLLHAVRDVTCEQAACEGAVSSVGNAASGNEQDSSSTYSQKLGFANRELL